jgi:hypothetical protein
MNRLLDAIERVYQLHIVDEGKQSQLLLLLAFLITFSIVRLITHMIKAGWGPIHNIQRGGLHIHHLVWGILLLLITGFTAISFPGLLPWGLLAVLFGIGAALTLDEFALWLNLEDVYWAKQGRQSVDAVIITATVFGVFLLGLQFWVQFGLLWLGASSGGPAGTSRDGLLVTGPWAVIYPLLALGFAVGLWKVFKKTGEVGWMAFIPVVNLVILLRIARLRWWLIFVYVIPVISLVVAVPVAVRLARRFGRGKWFAAGLAILPPVFYPILGFSHWQAKPESTATLPAGKPAEA